LWDAGKKRKKKEFGYIFQRRTASSKQTEANGLLSKPFCPHSNPQTHTHTPLSLSLVDDRGTETRGGGGGTGMWKVKSQKLKSQPPARPAERPVRRELEDAGVRTLSLGMKVFAKKNKAGFVLFYCSQLTLKLNMCLSERMHRSQPEMCEGKRRLGGGGQPVNRSQLSPPRRGLNTACFHRNPID